MRSPLSLLAAVPLVVALAMPAVGQQAASTAPFEPLGPDGHVLIVVIDGLRPDLITPHDAPTLTRLVEEGAATLDGRTVEPSHTLPSITSMLTGVRPTTHGITWNTYEPDKGLVKATTIFDVAHHAGLRTAFFAGKIKLRHVAPPRALDHSTISDRPDPLVALDARKCLAEQQPNLMLVHLPGVDQAGHRYGWRDDKQREALRVADASLGAMIAIIENMEPQNRWMVIVTADHGGQSRNHQRRIGANVRVPWIVWGKGVTRAKLPSISVTAVAATALYALGLDAPKVMEAGLGQ